MRSRAWHRGAWSTRKWRDAVVVDWRACSLALVGVLGIRFHSQVRVFDVHGVTLAVEADLLFGMCGVHEVWPRRAVNPNGVALSNVVDRQ